MRTVTVLGLGLLGLFSALPAQALTISNTDSDHHTVTIMAGSDSAEFTIELESGEQYEMEGGEEVAIEDGIVFVDAVPGREQ